MATSPIDQIQAAIQRAAKSTAATAKAEQQAAAANTADIEGLIQAITRSSAAETVLQTETLKGAQRLAESKARVASAAGGEAKLLEDISRVNQQIDQTRNLTDEVVRKRSRTIFDLVSDPVETIKDVVTLSSSETQLQGAALKLDTNVKAAQYRHQTLTQGFQQVEQTNAVVTAASVSATQDKLAALRDIELAKTNLEGRKFNLQGIKAAQAADLTIVDLASKSRAAVHAEEQLKIQRQQLAAAAESRRLQRQEMAARDQARKEGQDELAMISKFLVEGAAATGIALPSDGTLRLLAKEAATDKNSQAYRWFSRGLRNNSIGGSSRIGADPAGTVMIISQEDVNIPTSAGPAMAVLKKAQELLSTNPKTSQLSPRKDMNAWSTAYNKQVDALMVSEYAEVRPGSVADFGPNLASYINDTADLANLPVTKKFLAPMLQAGTPISDPQATMRAGVEAVRSGKISSEELIGGMKSIYQKAALIHMETTRMVDFGIVPPKAGRSYNVRLNGNVVDLTNGTELQRWVAKEIAVNNNAGLAIKNSRSISPFVFN